MLITASRPKVAKLPAPSSEAASTLHNEPNIPMDSVMRGFSQMDTSELGYALRSIAVGAAGGAAAGALRPDGWMIPMSMATTALSSTLDTGIEQVGRARSDGGYDHIALMAAPIIGAGTGLVGGISGYALSALTGLNPVVSGAIGGAATGLACALLTR